MRHLLRKVVLSTGQELLDALALAHHLAEIRLFVVKRNRVEIQRTGHGDIIDLIRELTTFPKMSHGLNTLQSPAADYDHLAARNFPNQLSKCFNSLRVSFYLDLLLQS